MYCKNGQIYDCKEESYIADRTLAEKKRDDVIASNPQLASEWNAIMEERKNVCTKQQAELAACVFPRERREIIRKYQRMFAELSHRSVAVADAARAEMRNRQVKSSKP